MKLACAALLTACLAAGCQDGPKIYHPESSTSGGTFDDLPAPPHFAYSHNKSDKNPTGAFRVVNQVLKGPSQRVEDAAKFYRDLYPTKGWKLEKEQGDPKAAVSFSFSNKEERCTVEIKDESPTVVVVSLKVDKKN